MLVEQLGAVDAQRLGTLPDGNKRAAWVCLRLFVESWRWGPKPTVDEAKEAVFAIATGGWGEHAAGA